MSIVIRRINQLPRGHPKPGWSVARPAQLQLGIAAQAKLVICDKTIERTCAWFTQCRRLSKDYEVLPTSSEAMIYLAMMRLMLRRLAV